MGLSRRPAEGIVGVPFQPTSPPTVSFPSVLPWVTSCREEEREALWRPRLALDWGQAQGLGGFGAAGRRAPELDVLPQVLGPALAFQAATFLQGPSAAFSLPWSSS